MPDLQFVKDFLDEKYRQFNRSAFIDSDPVLIPHLFTNKEDIEISGFLTATISWGKRPIIIRNAKILLDLMDMQPYQFVLHATDAELTSLQHFTHRTFNGEDCIFFTRALRNIYKNHNGLENIFSQNTENQSIKTRISHFREIFFEIEHSYKTRKHIANPEKNSSAKRINMFLRWMVRKDAVDFGLWKRINPSELMIPLDVHSGETARKLGILNRKQNDWKAVEELTSVLRSFDSEDPVKYDFALFGLGIFDKF